MAVKITAFAFTRETTNACAKRVFGEEMEIRHYFLDFICGLLCISLCEKVVVTSRRRELCLTVHT